MIRILFALGLVALIVIVWYLLQVVGGSIHQLHDAALLYAKCVESHNDDIQGLVRDSGNVRSYSDMEYNQYRARIKMQEIQGTCLNQSGFKTLVLRELDNTAMTDADRQSIRQELSEAQTFDDLEHIEKRIVESEQHH
jgi:hypothetical protein